MRKTKDKNTTNKNEIMKHFALIMRNVINNMHDIDIAMPYIKKELDKIEVTIIYSTNQVMRCQTPDNKIIEIKMPLKKSNKNNEFTIKRIQEDNQKEDKQEKIPQYFKPFMTKRNGINKLLQTDNRQTRDKIWQKIIKKSYMEKGITEHHLVINPKIDKLDENELLELLRNFKIKFYRKYLGKKFNKKKDEQIEFFTTVEYGQLYKQTKIKNAHLHLILKTKNQDMLNQFHEFIYKNMQEHFEKEIDYLYKPIDTPEYRINVYNYILKEGRESYTHSDFYYKKEKYLFYI